MDCQTAEEYSHLSRTKVIKANPKPWNRLSCTYLNCGHILGETFVLLAYLECQFACMAHDQDVAGVIIGWLQLLQRGKHKDSRFAHTGLGLAQDIHAEHSLRYALVLNCKCYNIQIHKNFSQAQLYTLHTFGWMLKTAVNDCTQYFGF